MPRLAAAVLLSGLLAACSSDTAPEPEAQMDQPGAFVAMQASDGTFTLYRTLDRLDLDVGRVLFISIYEVAPKTWDEAREMSKSEVIPLRSEVELFSLELLRAQPHRVVWFRTLSDEEKERVD